MSKLWIQLGKIGDILSIAPVLQREWRVNFKEPVLMVADQYKDVVASLPHIQTHVYNGHWQDLEGAIKLGKREYDEVVIPQTYGKTVAISHTEQGFQLDQWKRAGRLAYFDKLPLEVERPSNAQELVSRHLGSRPCILFADNSESSPFPHAEQCGKMLEKEFGKTHSVVRLSTIRLDRFCDCVALYDAADAVVVTETAHLHLSKATKTPVFAIATDKPSRWHGSQDSRHFRFYCRYSQYLLFEGFLMEGILNVLDGAKPPEIVPYVTDKDFGYNPSVARV